MRPSSADVYLDETRFVQRVGVDHHLTSMSSATERQQSIAAGVVPQSSCSLSAQRAGLTCSIKRFGQGCVALAREAEFIGSFRQPAACGRCARPGVQVVASVPWAGPVPPPSMVVTPE